MVPHSCVIEGRVSAPGKPDMEWRHGLYTVKPDERLTAELPVATELSGVLSGRSAHHARGAGVEPLLENVEGLPSYAHSLFATCVW